MEEVLEYLGKEHLDIFEPREGFVLIKRLQASDGQKTLMMSARKRETPPKQTKRMFAVIVAVGEGVPNKYQVGTTVQHTDLHDENTLLPVIGDDEYHNVPISVILGSFKKA